MTTPGMQGEVSPESMGKCIISRRRPARRETRHFRNYWELCGIKSAKALRRKALRAIERAGIGKSKRKSRLIYETSSPTADPPGISLFARFIDPCCRPASGRRMFSPSIEFLFDGYYRRTAQRCSRRRAPVRRTPRGPRASGACSWWGDRAAVGRSGFTDRSLSGHPSCANTRGFNLSKPGGRSTSLA
jgi:hypothetical protein